MYNLFLDDERIPINERHYPGDNSIYDTEDFIEVTNMKDFMDTIKVHGVPKFVSFDFKIAGPDDGLECARYLKFECDDLEVRVPPYRIHSGWPGISGQFISILGKENMGSIEGKYIR